MLAAAFHIWKPTELGTVDLSKKATELLITLNSEYHQKPTSTSHCLPTLMRISRSPASNSWAKQGPQRPEPKQLQTIEGKVSLKTSLIWLVTCPTQIVAKTGNKTHEDIGTFSAVKASVGPFLPCCFKASLLCFQNNDTISFKTSAKNLQRKMILLFYPSAFQSRPLPMSYVSKKEHQKKHQLFCLSLANYSSFKFQNHFHETLRLDMSWQLAVGLGHLRPWLFLGPSRRERQLPTAWCPTSHSGMGSEVASSTKLRESTMTVLFLFDALRLKRSIAA